MKMTQMPEKKEINVPRVLCRLFVHIDLADGSERARVPRSLLTVYGTIDDFRLSYPLSKGAELTSNKLPLETVEKLIIEDYRESSNVFAETSGTVFLPNAGQNLAEIAARYKALELRVTPVGGAEIGQILHKIKSRLQAKS
jgi:hypothetical protein